MKIKVIYFASIKERLGSSMEEVELPRHATVEALYGELMRAHEELSEWERVLLAVNGEYKAPSYVLSDGEVVAVFPPVSGG